MDSPLPERGQQKPQHSPAEATTAQFRDRVHGVHVPDGASGIGWTWQVPGHDTGIAIRADRRQGMSEIVARRAALTSPRGPHMPEVSTGQE